MEKDKIRRKGCMSSTFDFELGRYMCDVSGDGCMYMIPNSLRCAEDYGEGTDAVYDEESAGEGKDLF